MVGCWFLGFGLYKVFIKKKKKKRKSIRTGEFEKTDEILKKRWQKRKRKRFVKLDPQSEWKLSW